jgi:hypothetical protein
MTSLERLGIEIAAGLLLTGLFVGWWQLHNHTERTLGASVCIAQTTETKTAAVADNQADAALGALQLQLVVKTYDDQVSTLSRGNADLVQRLHDNALRAKPVSGTGPVAGDDLGPIDVSGGQSRAVNARRAALDRAEAQVLGDCDDDFAKLEAVTMAYNEVRARAIAAAAAAK